MPSHLRRTGVSPVLTGALLALSAPLAGAAETGVTAPLRAGKLQIIGAALNDTVTVRLSPTNTSDVLSGTSRAPDFRFRRTEVTSIAVDLGGGNDVVTMVATNGAFTDTILTTPPPSPPATARTRSPAAGVDSIEGSGSSESVTVGGLDPTTRIRRTDPNDQLLIDPRAGADQVLTTGPAPGSIELEVI